ncbi:alpha/beta-hydrolase [Microstroma glucosiphilum]|uniref:sn-1-specific diacylglycerol lipase n=1 Tax=Pseudomicrostroma glucosiphilum TaxID=1684307 RepID=A0A316UG68_9BASI|nr:alpha/beta-hydrolase [Pseudomicrostroma glucosiphilum]PWN23938.1 alpha/beta-hydrolase [Pseudomicrostroma glucosiphilum]
MMPHTPLPVQLSSAEACLPSISAAPSRSPLSTSLTHRRPDLHHSSSSIADVVHYASGPTLLPSRIAEAVSDVAVAARASLRAASFLVDVSLESVRFTTSFALDLTRKVLVGAATTDATFIQSKAMVEGYSARGVAIIHQNVAFVEFLVQASINLMQSSFRVSASIADESIKVFDELFGDNETSRALAAFIATVQHEFSKTKCAATGGGLTTFATFARAMTTFAFVQTATYKRTARDFNTKTLFDDALMPFPFRPLADNLQHFVRYASASYGSNFLNFLGLGESFLFENNEQAHANEWAFANHANISVEDVLLSSYTDDVGVSLRCSKMAPIVNFVAVDRERQAVVLACRGTLGMSDLLVDLTADYQDVKLGCGEGFVHRGMYAAAHRLSAATGTVASVLRQALEAHPTYGLVVVGHSLGGGIAILVGALWSCRSSNFGTAFVTSHSSGLPPGRPIHVFAYGPPPTADPILAKSMVGLVTTVIHHFDCIPMLSMGAVLDLRDISELLAACKGSSTEILCKTAEESYGPSEDWLWSLIKTLRAHAQNEKLYPPGTVYLTMSARRVVLRACEDVVGRFSE